MRMPIDYLLLKAVERGAESLSDEARGMVTSFVKSRMMEDTSFANRGGKSDLYYTAFGWLICYVLQIKLDDMKREAYLKSIRPDLLDELHKVVLEQCRLLSGLLQHGLWKMALKRGVRRSQIEDFFEVFAKHTLGRSVDGEAAALFKSRNPFAIKKEEIAGRLDFILSMQDETGGFLANEGAAIPDMLTTAVALFTLKTFKMTPLYNAEEFIELHFSDDGGFMPNLLDEESDVEYVFYGLLALGSL